MHEDERDAYAATVQDARRFMRGEYRDPAPGTLAGEINSFAQSAEAAMEWRAVRAFLVAAAVFLLGLALAALISADASAASHVDSERSPKSPGSGGSYSSTISGDYVGGGYACRVTVQRYAAVSNQAGITIQCILPDGRQTTGAAWGPQPCTNAAYGVPLIVLPGNQITADTQFMAIAQTTPGGIGHSGSIFVRVGTLAEVTSPQGGGAEFQMWRHQTQFPANPVWSCE